MKQIHHLSGIFQISGIANLQHWILFGLVDALLMFLGKKRSNFSFFQNKTSAVVACLKITCHLSQKKGPSNFVFSTALQYFQLNLTETFWYKNILLRLDEMHLVDSHWLVLNKRIFTSFLIFYDRNNSFGAYAKFPKTNVPASWDADLCVLSGVRNVSFLENFAY